MQPSRLKLHTDKGTMSDANFIDRLQQRIQVVSTYVSITMLSAVLVIVGIEIFCRYLLNSPLYWSNEVSLVAHIYAICFGYAAIYASRGDIYMTFLYDRLAKFPKLQRLNDVFAELISLAFLIVFLAITLKLLWLQHDYIVGGMGIPYYVYYGPIGITSLLLIPCAAGDLLRSIRSEQTILHNQSCD
jgi:TRAP-type C4-dicarboxylate transport system permease small subunit